jgi:hypothetical protein
MYYVSIELASSLVLVCVSVTSHLRGGYNCRSFLGLVMSAAIVCSVLVRAVSGKVHVRYLAGLVLRRSVHGG